MTNKQLLSTLQLFGSFNLLLKKLFVLHCSSEYIIFIAELLLNIVNGNVLISAVEKTRLMNFQKEISIIIAARGKTKKSIRHKRQVLSTNRGLRVINLITPAVEKHFVHLL